MAVNKIIYDNKVLIDLSEDTISTDSVLANVTFHKASGESSTGSIPVIEDQSYTMSIEGVDIPLGYHTGNSKVILSTEDLANLKPENIKVGVTILGITGTLE